MAIADQSRWRYVLTDMSGNPTGGGGPILNSSQKLFSYHLNSGKTAQFTINIDNPRAGYLLSNDCLVKVYRRNRLGTWVRMLVGDIISADESGQGDTGLVTVVVADPWWRIQRRLIGMGIDSIGRGTGYIDGTVASTIDYSNLVADILNNLNSAFNTGVSLGTVTLCGGPGSYLGPLYAQNAGEIWQQLCNTLGGPSFEIVPLEPSGSMPSTIIGSMNIVPAIGQSRPNCIFEYGTGKHNVASYDRILSKDGLCNKAYSPPQGFPDVSAAGDTMVVESDSTSINSIGLYEDLVQGDLVSVPLRQILATEYVTVRKYARQQIQFTPTVDCPMDYTVDYNVGDTATARAMVNNAYRFNGTARIYGIDIAVDDNDAETPSLVLIPGG